MNVRDIRQCKLFIPMSQSTYLHEKNQSHTQVPLVMT